MKKVKENQEVLEQDKIQIESIFFDFDNEHILSAMPDDIVILRCSSYEIEDDLIVYIDREMYHQIVEEWLDGKQGYYEREGHFAGCGQVLFDEIEEIKESNCNLLYIIDDKDAPDEIRCEYRPARSFIAYDFSIDMEHG